MKARVRATGEIVTIVENIGYPGGYVASNKKTYHDRDLELIVDEDPDYWTKLEHQYAGMAMQVLLSSGNIGIYVEQVVDVSKQFAIALVEKMKEAK